MAYLNSLIEHVSLAPVKRYSLSRPYTAICPSTLLDNLIQASKTNFFLLVKNLLLYFLNFFD